MVYMDKYTGPWTAEEAAHLCRRAGFGAVPDEIEAKVGAGMEGAVSSLVDYDPVDAVLEEKLASLREFEEYVGVKDPQDEPGLQGWWMFRMIHTTQPLQEQFTLFLHDHFVSEWDKVADGVSDAVNDGNDGSAPEDQRCTIGTLAPDENRRRRIIARLLKEQNELLRRIGHGYYRDTLLAVTRDPAMLIYLDNDQNVKDRPQENYSRELMELFSMGVGNYTEEDVREMAKALTGETIKTTCELDYPYSYFFHPSRHSREEKTVFGVTFNNRGRGEDTDQVIDLILHQVSKSGISPAHDRLPATAVYMAWKFITWFVNEEILITDPAVEELAEIFYTQQPNGYIYDVRETLRTLFESKFFYDEQYRFRMYKHPVDYVVSAYRCLEVDERNFTQLATGPLAGMGMQLFSPPNVAGWNHGKSWINSTNLVNRFNFADRLSRRVIMTRKVSSRLMEEGFVQNEQDHDGMIDFMRARLIQQPLSGEEMDILNNFLNGITAGRDQFRRKINGLAHIMMTMPKFQLK